MWPSFTFEITNVNIPCTGLLLSKTDRKLFSKDEEVLWFFMLFCMHMANTRTEQGLFIHLEQL